MEKKESILGDFHKGIAPQKSAKLSQEKVEDVKRGGMVGQFNLGVWKGWMKVVVKDG